MATYSFQDITATIVGIGGSFQLAAGAGSAEEGLTAAPIEDKNFMTIGAGGEGTHSLSANRSRIITVRLLKTSQVNAQLQNMYNLQTASAVTHGKNTITLRDVARGDFLVFAEVAFAREPDLVYAKESGNNEWLFHAIESFTKLGTGTPEI